MTLKIGKIFKIIHSQSNFCYVGSTFAESLTFKWRDIKKNEEFQAYHLKDLNIKDCKIVLVKEYLVLDKKHLRTYEQLWIKKLSYTPSSKNKQPDIYSVSRAFETAHLKFRDNTIEIRNWTCGVCDKTFKDRSSWIRHQETNKHKNNTTAALLAELFPIPPF